jgi:uncharacterized protein YbaR (Trm112 family)
MTEPDLLKILCCPETHQQLRGAGTGLVEQLNRQIAAGQLRNRAGASVNAALDAGLVRADGKVLYPIRGGIPVMLVDEAIPLPD